MNVVTFYADAELPAGPRDKQRGFDWRWAMGELARSAAQSLGAPTRIVTDRHTRLPGVWLPEPWLRIGDVRLEGIMLWLLDAQGAALAAAETPVLLVSPDTLLAGPVPLFDDAWDLCLLTRARPKPIVNSVIAARPGHALARLWNRMAVDARRLPAESRAWGADIDILVDTLGIRPHEDALRTVDGVRVRLMPMEPVFRSIDSGAPRRLAQPVWDFKGRRKQHMADWAALLREAA